MKIIALDCLVALVAKKSYEIEDFYKVIYSLLIECVLKKRLDLFQSSFSTRFIVILQMALESKQLSRHLTASYIKVLLHIVMIAGADIALKLSMLIFNTFKNRESVRDMIRVPADFAIEKDPFQFVEDFFSNNISQSCFWEILLLKRHYLSEVRYFYKQIGGNQLDQLDFIDLNEFAQFDLLSLISQKVSNL